MHHFGRILKISIHEHDRIPISCINAGGHSNLVAEVTCKADNPDAGVTRCETFQEFARAVTAAIVYKDQLYFQVFQF